MLWALPSYSHDYGHVRSYPRALKIASRWTPTQMASFAWRVSSISTPAAAHSIDSTNPESSKYMPLTWFLNAHGNPRGDIHCPPCA